MQYVLGSYVPTGPNGGPQGGAPVRRTKLRPKGPHWPLPGLGWTCLDPSPQRARPIQDRGRVPSAQGPVLDGPGSQPTGA